MEPIVGGIGARVDLRDVKVIERIGGTVEDTELVQGLVIPHRASNVSGPHRIEKAKVGLIQFCISPPKTDVCIELFFLFYHSLLAFLPLAPTCLYDQVQL